MNRTRMPAREEDIARVEEKVGVRLPDWLRARLLAENGFELDDGAGITGKVWRMLPVMDRSQRSRMSRTAQDIAWHTAQVREVAGLSGAVVVGYSSSSEDRLVLMPSVEDPAVLGTELFRQTYLSPPQALGVGLAEFAPSGVTAPDEPLPVFRYHPDPLATGMIRLSPNVCEVCTRPRGWQYTTTPYGVRTLATVCPWCIADGSAAALGARFSDGWLLLEAGVDHARIDEATKRTPGFASIQQEEWQTCCADACAFVGALSGAQIAELPAEVRAEHQLDGAFPDGYAVDLTVFGFRCLHCGAPKVWLDFP